MWFNKRGPVPVSDDSLKAYQKLFVVKPTFQMLYNVWTDEHYDEAIRRLCLRDMIWQSSDKIHDANACYYETDKPSLIAMFECASPSRNANDGKTRLAGMLKLRPRLLDELYQEFIWLPSPEESWQCQVPSRRSDYDDEMIEFLLPLIDEARGRQLWRHHSKSSNISHNVARLEIWEGMAGQPIWLDNLLRNNIYENLRQEVKNKHVADALPESVQYVDLPCVAQRKLRLLLHVINTLSSYQYETERKGLKHFVELVRMLNDLLPQNFRYLDFATLCAVMPELSDCGLIVDVCRRHLSQPLVHPINMQYVEMIRARNFLFWLRGIVTQYSNDREFLDNIDKLIKQWNARPDLFAPDGRKVAQSLQPESY